MKKLIVPLFLLFLILDQRNDTTFILDTNTGQMGIGSNGVIIGFENKNQTTLPPPSNPNRPEWQFPQDNLNRLHPELPKR
jgi:hypothetical protein